MLPLFAEAPQDEAVTARIPLGVTEHGQYFWEPEYEPHVLLAGRTRTGKTSLVRTIVKGLSDRGASIVLIDPKRSALVDVEGLPGVIGRATSRDLDDVAHKISWVERQMYERYDLMEQGVKPEEFPLLALVVDEGRMLYEVTKTHWNTFVKPRMVAEAKAVKSARRPVGTEHPCIEQIRSILRLGGEARVSVILISQQADASWLSTEARQNLGVRVALGNMDDDGLGMLFGRRTKVEPLGVSEDGSPIKGRAWVATVGSKPVQMQAYWTPEIAVQPVRRSEPPTQPIPVPGARRSLLARILG